MSYVGGDPNFDETSMSFGSLYLVIGVFFLVLASALVPNAFVM